MEFLSNYPILLYSGIFFFIALAAKKIGAWFSSVGLPYITGYLLAGMVAGPFVLGLLPTQATTDLRFIDEISLGVIAFVAGSELYLKEIRSRLKSISFVSGGVVLLALPIMGVVLFFLTELIPFTQGMPTVDRLGVAILGSTILLALSPASTIAVIKEVRARGDFTRTILGVTVTMDVIIIVLFAVAVAIGSALLTGMGFSASFVVLLVIDIGAAVALGYLVGKLLNMILAAPFRRLAKILLILGTGYAIFVFSYWLVDFSKVNFPFELHVEPILVAVIGGFMVTNYTPYREEFAEILHDVGPAVYVAFFTLTGVAIKLDILLQTWPVALALFATRGAGIFLGTMAGSRLAGESKPLQRYGWMGLITQAGIALGLAREVAVEFPTLGDAFATMVISVVVLNEIFGPLFLKAALRRSGETHEPQAHAEDDDARDAVIFGIENQSLELARQLQRQQWNVIMADTDASHVEALQATDVIEHHIEEISKPVLDELITDRTDAVVALLPTDEENLRLCQLAYEKGVPRLIARLNDLALADEFRELGALIVDQTSAMVYLLEQTVRAPSTAAVLLHQNGGREMVQITIRNPDVAGLLLRDLRLPTDVLFLDVNRNGTTIVPNGYTRLNLNDEVTVLAREDSLDEVILKLGY